MTNIRAQERPTKETYSKKLQKRPEEEGAEGADGTSGCRLFSRALRKRPAKETYIRDLQKRPAEGGAEGADGTSGCRLSSSDFTSGEPNSDPCCLCCSNLPIRGVSRSACDMTHSCF